MVKAQVDKDGSLSMINQKIAAFAGRTRLMVYYENVQRKAHCTMHHTSASEPKDCHRHTRNT